MTTLDKTAVSLAESIRRLAGDDLPVDVKKLCALLGIDGNWEPMSVRIDGLHWRTSGGVPVIFVNTHTSKSPGRVLRSGAHEMGHEMLQRVMRLDSEHVSLDCGPSWNSPLERACDLFADTLLMPETLLQRWFCELRYNPQYRISIMAERCGVDKKAMLWRLQYIGLLPRRYTGRQYR